MNLLETRQIGIRRCGIKLENRQVVRKYGKRIEEKPMAPVMTPYHLLSSDELKAEGSMMPAIAPVSTTAEGNPILSAGVTWTEAPPLFTRVVFSPFQMMYHFCQQLSLQLPVQCLPLDFLTFSQKRRRETILQMLKTSEVVFTTTCHDDFAFSPDVHIYRELLDIRAQHALTPAVGILLTQSIEEDRHKLADIAHLLQPHDFLLVPSRIQLTLHTRTMRNLFPMFQIPLGVQNDMFKPYLKEVNRMVRLTMGIPPDAFVLVYSGRISAEKNLHALAWILEKVVEFNKDVVLIIAGPIDNRETTLSNGIHLSNAGYYDTVRHEFESRSLGRYTFFLGNQPRRAMAMVYSMADALIQPSISPTEHTGYAVLEAMAAKTPVICSAVGQLKDFIVDGENGFLMDSWTGQYGKYIDWNRAVDLIYRLMKNSSLGATIGMRAWEEIQRFYSYESTQEQFRKIFKKICTHICADRTVDYSWRQSMETLSQSLGTPYVGEINEIHKPNMKSILSLTTPIFMTKTGKMRIANGKWVRQYQLDDWEVKFIREIDGRAKVTDIVGRAPILSEVALLDFLYKLLREDVVYMRNMP